MVSVRFPKTVLKQSVRLEAAQRRDHEAAKSLPTSLTRAVLFCFVAPPVMASRDRTKNGRGHQNTGQLKLKLQDINQNPFRQSLLDTAAAADGSGGSGDISEDMSWGFDQTFFGEEGDGDGDDDPDDYDDI